MTYIRKNDGTFILIENKYHIVSKEVDPYNRYDIKEVEAFAEKHPEEIISEDEYFAESINQEKINSIKEQLLKLDLESIRSLRSIVSSKSSLKDFEVLSSIEEKASVLRQEITSLTGEKK